MYDTTTSRLITLKQLAEMLKNGSQVRIEDNDSGDDITRPAILQMLLEIEKSGKSIRTIMPDLVASIFNLPQINLVNVLKDLIQKNRHKGELGRAWAQKVVHETSLGALIPVNMEKKIVAEIAGQLDELYKTILGSLEEAVKNRRSIYEIYDNILKAMNKAIRERDSIPVETAAALPARRRSKRIHRKKERP